MQIVSRLSVSRKVFVGGTAAILSATLLFVHGLLLSLPDETTTPLMIIDRLFDLGLVGVFSLGAVGVGRWLLRRLGHTFKPTLARSILAWGVGAGVLSHGLLLLGFVHLLSKLVVLLLLVVVVGWTAKEWITMGRELMQAWQTRSPLTRLELVLICLIALLILPVLFGALAPPTDGDALSYQLAAPSLFLEQQGIVPVFENTGANYPLGTSLLFIFGLAAESPIAAQLTHFLFGLVLMGAIYAFASENFGRPVGLMASAIYWTSPVIGLEANAPLVDLGWVFYEFLAIWMFWRWHQSRDRITLIWMAVFVGLSLCSKYLAFIGLGTLILFVIADILLTDRGVWLALQCSLIVWGVALVVAAPWYLKNLFLLGNPVYPFFLGTYGLDGQIQNPVGAMMGLGEWVGAGMGHDLQALLSFPLNVYTHWQNFDPVKNRGGPSLLFWFLPFYLIVPKHDSTKVLLLIAAIRFGVWWNLTQFVRYGLILFPILSIICGYTLWKLLQQVRGKWSRPLLRIVVAIFFAIDISLQWGFLFFLHEGTIPFLLGMESRADYLDTNLLDYRATRFINTTLPADAKIFALGDTRVYYTQRRVIGDVSHENWVELATLGHTAEGVRDRLQEIDVMYVWVSEDDLTYARNFWNIPEPWHDPNLSFDHFRDCCLVSLYADEHGNTVYALHK